MSYADIATQSRIKVLDLIFKAQTSHIGSNFSAADIMAVLFEKIDLDKDKFILSAGWKAAMLYYHLWRKGRITEEELNSYCQPGSKWIGLSEPIHPDIPFAGGSMGMGLPAAVGFALAKKLKGEEGKVYCLMSDGELAIGTTWESALMAAQHKLDNLVVIVDNNGFQAMGKVEEILKATFPSDGWTNISTSFDVDGHDHGHLANLLSREGREVYGHSNAFTQPQYLICKTHKGYPISFMTDSNLYHYKQLSEEEYNKALEELK